MKETAGYLPGLAATDIEWRTLTFQTKEASIDVDVPKLTPSQMTDLIARLRRQRETHLQSRRVSEIVEVLDQVIQRLLDPSDPYRQKMDRLLPIITGYDREMVRLGLTSYLKTFRKPQLLRFLQEDFGNPGLLDGFWPRAKGGYAKAVGPEVIAHVWAGNVPGLPLWSLVSGLLVKSANIGKVASAEPLFISLFVRALAEIDPELVDCLAVVWWKGGDEEAERTVFAQADVVVGYGTNRSLSAVQSRVPVTTRFLPFGQKISFGMIGRETLNARKALPTIRLAAYDVIRYDQQGCYSPHVFYVERGGQISPREAAQYLAHELDGLQHKFPRRDISLEEARQVAEIRQQAEWKALSGGGTEWLGGADRDWTVVYEETAELLPSCLNRTIRVIAVDDLQQVPALLSASREYLQTVSLAVAPERLFLLGDQLARAGVTRICGLGEMTSPEAGWHHDGRFNLSDLVKMVDLDQSAEQLAERYAPYQE